MDTVFSMYIGTTNRKVEDTEAGNIIPTMDTTTRSEEILNMNVKTETKTSGGIEPGDTRRD